MRKHFSRGDKVKHKKFGIGVVLYSLTDDIPESRLHFTIPDRCVVIFKDHPNTSGVMSYKDIKKITESEYHAHTL